MKMMIKKLILGAFMLSTVVVHSFTKENIASQYNTILDGIVHYFDENVTVTIPNTLGSFDVCANWKIAVVLVKQLYPDTKVTDVNLIVLVDILNNHSYSEAQKEKVKSNFSYFQNNCQPVGSFGEGTTLFGK